MSQAVNPILVASYARRKSVEDLDVAIEELSNAFLTSQFSNISVLGLNTGQNGEQAEVVFQTLEQARQMKLEMDPDTGAEAVAIALDAKSPLGISFDFSSRQIE